MKSLKASLIALSILPISTAGAALVYDFESVAPDTYFTGGVSGWTQSDPNPPFDDGVVPLASVLAGTGFFGSSNQVGYLGTTSANNPYNATTSLTGALPTSTSVVNSQVSLDFAIADANNPIYPARDEFSVSIIESGTVDSLAAIIFTPDATDDTLWTISISVNGITTDTAYTLTENSEYSLYFNFTDTSVELMYAGFGLTPVSLGTVASSIDSSAELGDIVISHTQTTFGTSVYSDNGAIFDNIATAVIPEPSVALLGGIAALGLLRRRRSN